MSLTRVIAAKIVWAVQRDSNTRRRIMGGRAGTSASILPDSWGVSGAIRNWRLVLTGADPMDRDVAAIVCTGISDAAIVAINNARRNDAEIPEADLIHRCRWGVHHYAVRVTMNGSEYVFDWHATLNVDNPMISRANDWTTARGAVTFSNFTGFH